MVTGKSIYLLEDDPDILQLLTLLLSRQGYAVSCFMTVTELNHQLTLSLPDLFIFDVNLPDGNGLDLAAKLSAGDTTSQIPIIIMSANIIAKTKYLQSGAWHFIGKPFSIDEFIAAVKQHV